MVALPYDKALHVIAGFTTYAGCHLLQLGDNVCLGVGIAVGIGKEVVDKVSGHGTPELMDAIATSAGTVVGYSVTFHF